MASPMASTPWPRHHSLITSAFDRDRKGMLLSLSAVFSEEANNIMDVHSETLNPGVEAAFQFTVQV